MRRGRSLLHYGQNQKRHLPASALKRVHSFEGKQFLAIERGIAVIVGVLRAEFLKTDGFGCASGRQAQPD
jgi:hypothetical protein